MDGFEDGTVLILVKGRLRKTLGLLSQVRWLQMPPVLLPVSGMGILGVVCG